MRRYGQIIRMVIATMPTGEATFLVEVDTRNGPVLGQLIAPDNGVAGVVTFEPTTDPLLVAAAGQPLEEDLPLIDPEDAEHVVPFDDAPAALTRGDAGTGALTTAQVPTKGERRPPSPDDPRGLRS